MSGTLILEIGAESVHPLDWYQITDAVGAVIADLLAGVNVRDQTAIAHVAHIRSSVPGLVITSPAVPMYGFRLDPLLRPIDKLQWGRDKPEGPERWRIRRYPVIDAATHRQATRFYWEMYGELLTRLAIQASETAVSSSGSNK
jgi:hypothetical protein